MTYNVFGGTLSLTQSINLHNDPAVVFFCHVTGSNNVTRAVCCMEAAYTD